MNGTKERCFGWLRLAFAAMVVIHHAPALIHHDLLHDPLRKITPGLALGGFAVDFFFIISGYLIAGSYLNSLNARGFVRNRLLRVYPAFGFMFLVQLLFLGPLAGGAVLPLNFSFLWHEIERFLHMRSNAFCNCASLLTLARSSHCTCRVGNMEWTGPYGRSHLKLDATFS
jgi:peptidoglycan/LPS O-acetylase OafA/YrhL